MIALIKMKPVDANTKGAMYSLRAALFTAASMVLALHPSDASAATYFEDFNETPFGQWENGWLAVNSNLKNYYVVGNLGGADYRGNNPDGLWISDGVNDGVATINFSPAFGAKLNYFSFDVASYVESTLTIFDSSGQTLLSKVIVNTAGAYTLPGVYTHYSVWSATGIGGFSMSGFAEGNISIDNVLASTGGAVPEPASWAMMIGGFGFAGAALRRRRYNLKVSLV